MNMHRNKFMLISRYSVFLSVVLLSAGAVVAAAGMPDAPPPPDRPGDDRPEGPPLPGERIEAELAYIKTALKLTDRQLPAWETVADALRARAKRIDAEIGAHRAARNKTQDGDVQAVDPITGLEDRQRSVAAEADDLARLLNVLKPFYAALTAEQREAAEELLPPGPFGPPMLGPPMPGPPMPCPPPFAREFH